MSDLISRSALMEEIKSLQVSVTGLRVGKGILNEYAKHYRESLLRIIDEQPTAYDVEAVMKTIEDVGALNLCTLASQDVCYGYMDCNECQTKALVEIIRKGGIDESQRT